MGRVVSSCTSRLHMADENAQATVRMAVDTSRWKFLRNAIVKRSNKCSDETKDREFWQRTSVRRFGSFKLLSTEELSYAEASLLNNAHLSRHAAAAPPGLGTWIRYSYNDSSLAVSAAIKFLTAPVSLSAMAGFNNTGNVCVWPSEEVMAWYCLKNARHLVSGRSVCELGCGMTGLAGLMLARTGLPSEVLLTDGNETSVRNIDAILSANPPSLTCAATEVSALVLRWDDAFLSQRTQHDGSFDVVICADCVFFTELHACLAKVLQKLLKPSGTVILFAPERGTTLRQFCGVAAKDFVVRRLDSYDDVVDLKHREALGQTAGGEYDPDLHYPVLVELHPKVI